MTNHELLNMIGEVNEDHVLEAGDNVVRPRFRWGTLAACAACAALIVAAWPAWQALSQTFGSDASLDVPEGSWAPVQQPGLHEYTLVEGDEVCAAIAIEGDAKLPEKGGAASGQGAPLPEPAQPPQEANGPVADSGNYAGGGTGTDDIDGFLSSSTASDAAVQAASEWYNALLYTYSQEPNPEWYGGAWLAGDELLAVAIVDGFRTPELEAEIQQAAGAGAVIQFSTVKYSIAYLYSLIEPASLALDGSRLVGSIGVDLAANCVGVDLYDGGATVPDSVLAALAHLDPDGDAIRVRVFTRSMNTLTDEARKGPVPDLPAVESVPAPAEPAVEGE